MTPSGRVAHRSWRVTDDETIVRRALEQHRRHNYSHNNPEAAFDRLARELHTLRVFEHGRRIAGQARLARRTTT